MEIILFAILQFRFHIGMFFNKLDVFLIQRLLLRFQLAQISPEFVTFRKETLLLFHCECHFFFKMDGCVPIAGLFLQPVDIIVPELLDKLRLILRQLRFFFGKARSFFRKFLPGFHFRRKFSPQCRQVGFFRLDQRLFLSDNLGLLFLVL
ncbi:hypothetical protein SDC9_184594 [bioreactor metagenome]|uniref:Uncharacterized protein n=1 Tax=bioreactor metagenome TaxID=1076179 RepID=A0A645HDG4_9ZZZZ